MTLLAVAVAGAGSSIPAEPVFRADDEALLRGGAAFETIPRVRWPAVPARPPPRPLPLFRRGARAPWDGRGGGAVELVAAATVPDHVLRLYRTSQALVATAAALLPGLEELRARGLTLRSFDLGAPPSLLAGAKTTSYDVVFAARREAERARRRRATSFRAGRVPEAATANVWWRRGDDLYTPAVEQGALPGVTRRSCARSSPVHEGESEVAGLLSADEVFLTSSIREAMLVVAIDGAAIGDGRPGPAAARLWLLLR